MAARTAVAGPAGALETFVHLSCLYFLPSGWQKLHGCGKKKRISKASNMFCPPAIAHVFT